MYAAKIALTLWLLASPTHFQPLFSNAQYCGQSWAYHYTELHNSMLNGQRPLRRLVSVPVHSGFADRMVGSVSAMLFALLSDRAISFESYTANGGPGTRLRPLTDVFTIDTIDWSRAHTPPEIVKFLNEISPTNEAADALHKHSYGSINSTSSSYYIMMVNGWGSDKLFTDVLRESAEFETVYLILNRGTTVSAFQDPIARARLQSMGLTARSTFGCLYKYAFHPSPAVFSRFSVESSILADRYALKIGIQIRTGDLAGLMDSTNRTSLELFHAFFDCAQEIEDTRRLAGQRVIWYFLSDSMQLRRAAAEKYKGKIYVKTRGVDVSHTAKETVRQGEGQVTRRAYQSIAGEVWLFSQTDFQVISFDSGIGRSAAFLGLHSNDTIYTINKWWDAQPPTLGQPRRCGIQDVDDFKSVASTWSLI